jgi:uncharacterized membrane protein
VEIFVTILLLALALVLLVGPLVLSLVAYVRSRRLGELTQRLERLERMVGALHSEAREPSAVAPASQGVREPPPEVFVTTEPHATTPPLHKPALRPGTAGVAFDWEWFIGRRALGWAAVVLIIFASGFFLRYAFENNWIGPIGRVSLAATGGWGLVFAGWHHDSQGRGALFARMLSGAGVVLIYLATYSAFGFYHLLPQFDGALYLLIVVAESMALAALYDSPALALVSIVGGLLTPVLMQSESDQYAAFFLYLGLLDTGALLLVLWRPWPAVATVALCGTQVLFWAWYGRHYHPVKVAAALGFQSAVFLLFLGEVLVAHALRVRTGLDRRDRVRRWEVPGRWLLNACLGLLAFYVLLDPDYAVWMGCLSLAMAALYAALALRLLTGRPEDETLFLTSLAIAAGFIATALAIEAKAPWIALGWAVEGVILWCLGLRVRSLPLRGLATLLAAAASIRVIFFDTFGHASEPVAGMPLLNEHIVPAIGASACLLAAVAASRWIPRGPGALERKLIPAFEVAGILQLWLVLSVDLYRHCEQIGGPGTEGGERLGQMALSILWAVYATVLLVVGFRLRLARLRWSALGLYGVTIAKVFLLDMAGLDQIYRILAFLVLAVGLGAAARVYQRIGPEREKPVTGES